MKTLDDYARLTQQRLEMLLPDPAGDTPVWGEIPPLLARSMRYSLFAGGKRLRPAMLLAVTDMLGGDMDAALDFACAAEMIHTYSLIHDDLPGMDDDVLRRGKPTNHVVFGVGQAILAGDGLLNFAFEVMTDCALAQPSEIGRVRALREIARGAGVTGMVAGQTMDLYAESHGGGEDMLNYIHRGKTMAMFMGALRAGACLAGANDAEMNAVDAFAEAYGLLFQATDDLLDVLSDDAAMGKSVGKDQKSGKLTAVSLTDINGAKARIDRLRLRAHDALAPFGTRAAFFHALTDDTATRKH